MSEGSANAPQSSSDPATAETDERYLVRNPRQIRQLLQALIDNRSLINAHLGGRDRSFPTAVLELDPDGDWLLLDGSPQESANAAAEQASHLLCFAQLDRVMVRFRLEKLSRASSGGHAAFRAPFPEELCHLQRRELYRLETPITDSPICTVPVSDDGTRTTEFRVLDISGGGIALALPPEQRLFSLQKRYPGCLLKLPDAAPIQVALVVCNMFRQTLPNGTEQQRVGLRFDELPRGADAAIQRYIFRIERQRSARKNGDL
ncbi:flagellar brake protein [Flavobacterium sp. MXW15]|uniref:Flagellar brake protein YcgR n=1 Tax=Xanthomonas chitinilytica TaxID=2989819 RepID=A0ABT3JVZ7_9XANT|nr:flagellar brake protein [Xanthomonas sp. H13-6]MCW4455171.1 flagellar brake protein [Flavobacterium sp. MXW15]MCW4472662.1 flagellar brake protein [Xanthomonas sp. H13-6]